MHVMQLSSNKSIISVHSHSSMYSDCDHICDATFIENSAGKSLIPSPSLTRSDRDSLIIVPLEVLFLYLLQHVVTVIMQFDAIFITDNTSDATFIDNSPTRSCILYILPLLILSCGFTAAFLVEPCSVTRGTCDKIC